MSVQTTPSSKKKKYHPQAYSFVFDALRYTQEHLQKSPPLFIDEDDLDDLDEDNAHISGEELLHGIKEYAKQEFGWLAHTIFKQWNVTRTDDFGYIVYELIDSGKMRKTDRDSLTDFFNVYNFEFELEHQYQFDFDTSFED